MPPAPHRSPALRLLTPPPLPALPAPRAAAWLASQSLWQLALALELAAELPGLQGPPQFFDPALSHLDRRLIAAAGGKVLSEDERGARQAQAPTLLYMPACPLPMYQYLLEANLEAGQQEEEGGQGQGEQQEEEGRRARLAGLRKLVVLGTSLEYLVEHARLVGREEGAGGGEEEAEEAAGQAGEAGEEEEEEVEDDMSDSQLDLELLREVLQEGGLVAFELPDIAQLHLTSVTRLMMFGCDTSSAAEVEAAV